MRILQLGVGSVGEVTVRTVASEPEVTSVLLADIDESRLHEVAGKLPPGKMAAVQLDVNDRKMLLEALAGVDLVINGLIPEVNLDVMAACLETGTHYLDMAAAGPRDVVGTADVDEELALHYEFRKAGLTALVFFRIDPGASDVFARAPYDQFDTLERLTVLDGDASSADGVDFAPSFSPATMVEECQNWVNLLLAWRKLGFDHNKEIEFGGARFRPLDLLVSRLPRSVDLIGKMHGAACVGTLAEGSIGGKRVGRFMYQMTSHDEAYERFGVQGTGWQTGVPAACAAIMLVRGLVPGRGVFAPEQIDPAPFLDLMTKHGTPWAVMDLPPGEELPIQELVSD